MNTGPEGVRHTNTGDADIIEANIKDGVTIFGTEGTYAGPPVPPSTRFNSNKSNSDKSYLDPVSGASDYLLIMNEGSPVTFIPANGTAYSEGSQVGGDIVQFGSDNFDTKQGYCS